MAAQEALDVAGHRDVEGPHLDLVDHAQQDAVLIAGIRSDDHALPFRFGVEQRPEGQVHLGVHQDNVAAPRDGPLADLAGEGDGVGGLDHHVHAELGPIEPKRRTRQQDVIPSRQDAVRLGDHSVAAGGLGCLPGVVEVEVGHRHEPHARRARHLPGNADAHRPGAHQGDPDGAVLGFKLAEGGKHDRSIIWPARGESIDLGE